jgi:hypothetical protein
MILLITYKSEPGLLSLNKLSLFKERIAWHWWLTSVVLATQKAEIRRIMV